MASRPKRDAPRTVAICNVISTIFMCAAFTVTCVIEPAVPIVGMLVFGYVYMNGSKNE